MKIEVGKYYHTDGGSVAFVSKLLIDQSTKNKSYFGTIYDNGNQMIGYWNEEGKMSNPVQNENLFVEIEDPIGYVLTRISEVKFQLKNFEKESKDWMKDQSTILHRSRESIDRIEKWADNLIKKLNNQKWFSSPFRKF